MRITQGSFSFLPDLTDAQIRAQVEYCLAQGWAVSIEHTDDPHPRNTYWEMFGQPMFDLRDAAGAMAELASARSAHPNHFIKLNGLDSTRGFETQRLSFIVNRPRREPAFDLVRQEAAGRSVRYTVQHRAAGPPVPNRPPQARDRDEPSNEAPLFGSRGLFRDPA